SSSLATAGWRGAGDLALTRTFIGVLDKTVVRVVYSDETGTSDSFKREPYTVVVALLLNMDSQWIPVRDAVEAALKETLGKSDDELGRYVIKGKALYHQIDRGEVKAKELVARLMAIPRQHLVPVWYGAVNRDGFQYQMENIHVRAQFKERDRPFMFALEECMKLVDTWVHSTLPEDKVIWIHDEGSLNERARETLRGFRWFTNDSQWAEFDPLVEPVIIPDAHVTHIADMVYFGDDKASRILQLVDVCCSTIARWIRKDVAALPFYELLRSQVQNHGMVPWYEDARKTVMPLRQILAQKRTKR